MPHSVFLPRALACGVLSIGLMWLVGCPNPGHVIYPPVPVPPKPAVTPATGGVVVQPGFLNDIPGGADKATLTQAAQFAWQEFIAANWPAVPQTGLKGAREQADTTRKFGDQSVPLVWHTLRSKVEIYPWLSRLPPGTIVKNDGSTVFNYDALPEYLYKDAIPPGNPASGQGPVAWINLDETSEIGLNQMFAGSTPPGPVAGSSNSAPQLIRFLAKANRSHFDYVTQLGYYNHGGDYYTRINNHQNAIAANQPPNQSTNPTIQFPAGTMMVKSAWRLLGPNDDRSRYHTTTVRFYEKGANGQVAYYQEQSWGMIALHIIVKTPTAPAFVFATFEQQDNLRLPDGKSLEDADGKIVGAVPVAASQPTIQHTDAPPATTTTAVGDFVTPAYPGDQRLFYRELAPSLPKPDSGPGAVAVNRRFESIPNEIIAVNTQAHAAIAAYSSANGVAGSPWGYYKLVNVQPQPFNQADITPTTGGSVANSPRGRATFFQANIVVETDYTLGQFAGVLIQSGAETGQTSNFNNPGKTQPAFNVHIPNGTSYNRHNMGGCMGCHGNAQVAGTDFSFILNFGPILKPDAPSQKAEGQALIQHYIIKSAKE
jgi:hypothetical protein